MTGTPPAEESLAGFLDRVRILCTVYDPRRDVSVQVLRPLRDLTAG